MKLTNEQFKSMFPNASRSVLEINHHLSHTKPQRPVPNESLEQAAREEKSSKRCVVSITSFRCRLTDPDNLCPKYIIDSLRYAGALYDDREEDIELHVSQKKVSHRTQERTDIEITWP